MVAENETDKQKSSRRLPGPSSHAGPQRSGRGARPRRTDGVAMTDGSPALSIGLAVRNGGHGIKRCIQSILSQDFTDLELVVSDNVSDDGTIETLESYARVDPRIKLNLNRVNIGSHENMRLVLDASRGTFFRWISHDDWL